MAQILQFKEELSQDDFSAMPFMNAKGYHSKSISFSLWHIFRIEDIVAHTLIAEDEQVFFRGDYRRRINSPIITTGNELVKHEIAAFSEKLSVEEGCEYVMILTECVLEDGQKITDRQAVSYDGYTTYTDENIEDAKEEKASLVKTDYTEGTGFVLKHSLWILWP